MKFLEKYSTIIIVAFVLSMFIKPPIFCFFILGSLASYSCVQAIYFNRKMQRKGIKSIGRILSYQSEGRGYKTPIFEFTSIDGNLITEKPHIYCSTDLNKIRSYKKMLDKEVSVLYDPDDPQKFIVADEIGFNYIALGFILLIGLVFIILSFCGLFGYIKFT